MKRELKPIKPNESWNCYYCTGRVDATHNLITKAQTIGLCDKHVKIETLEVENEKMRQALENISKIEGSGDKVVCLLSIGYAKNTAKEALANSSSQVSSGESNAVD